jgi:hypothetical protein
MTILFLATANVRNFEYKAWAPILARRSSSGKRSPRLSSPIPVAQFMTGLATASGEHMLAGKKPMQVMSLR